MEIGLRSLRQQKTLDGLTWSLKLQEASSRRLTASQPDPASPFLLLHFAGQDSGACGRLSQ